MSTNFLSKACVLKVLWGLRVNKGELWSCPCYYRGGSKKSYCSRIEEKESSKGVMHKFELFPDSTKCTC